MQRNREEEWQHLLEYTRQMLQKAEAGEWDTLRVMAVERHASLERFFNEPVPEEMNQKVEKGIRSISKIDGDIAMLAKEAGKNSSEKQGDFQRRQRAFRAYSAN